jgi:hypothetical protein
MEIRQTLQLDIINTLPLNELLKDKILNYKEWRLAHSSQPKVSVSSI